MIQIICLAILLAFLGSPIAWCNDIEDLQAAVLDEYNAFARGDCKTMVSIRTDPHVQYTPRRVKPEVATRDGSLKSCADGNFFAGRPADVRSGNATPVDLQYQVFGTTGIVYGRVRYESTLKDGSTRSQVGRRLETWVKTEGKWLRAAVQLSPVPSGE